MNSNPSRPLATCPGAVADVAETRAGISTEHNLPSKAAEGLGYSGLSLENPPRNQPQVWTSCYRANATFSLNNYLHNSQKLIGLFAVEFPLNLFS
jgi:hypothetical protein